MLSGHGPDIPCGLIGPGQQLVELALGMAVDDARDDVEQVGVWLDADELAGFDE